MGRTDGPPNYLPVEGSSSFFGRGFVMNATQCNILETDDPATASIDAISQVAFPDNATLKIKNNTSGGSAKDVLIKYWDEGTGAVSLASYPFTCTGVGTIDYTIPAGDSVVLKREGALIFPVKMDCEGEFGGPATIGGDCSTTGGDIDGIYNDQCECEALAVIPTLSQWGLMALSLGIVIFATVAIREKKKVLTKE